MERLTEMLSEMRAKGQEQKNGMVDPKIE